MFWVELLCSIYQHACLDTGMLYGSVFDLATVVKPWLVSVMGLKFWRQIYITDKYFDIYIYVLLFQIYWFDISVRKIWDLLCLFPKAKNKFKCYFILTSNSNIIIYYRPREFCNFFDLLQLSPATSKELISLE